MDRIFRIGQAAKLLGVSSSTLRRWEREGKLIPERTEGAHRLYRLSQFKSVKNRDTIRDRKTIAYGRVSSSDQKADLERQKKVLEMYCAAHGW
jgi:excisionase family DNA binding protein